MTDIASYPYTRYESYVPSIEVNPASIFYQRITSQNVSETNCQFTIRSPSARAYLQSKAMIDWKLKIEKVDTTAGVPNATSVPWNGCLDYFGLKNTSLPISNSFSSVTCSVNGSSTTISQPRRIFDCLSQCMVTKDESDKYFSGKYPNQMGGAWNFQGLNTVRGPAATKDAMQLDQSSLQSYEDMNSRLLRRGLSAKPETVYNAAAFFNNVADATISVLENLICPPFDCYADCDKTKMPYWSPWRYMSQSIPNIQSLEIDIQMNHLAASVLFPQYAQNQVAANVAGFKIGGLNSVAADLLLYWSEQNPQAEIPRSVDLQTYQIREFQKVLGLIDYEYTTVDCDLIQLQSVPSAIIIHVEKNKDSPLYTCTALGGDDNGLSNVVYHNNTGQHCFDSYAEIVSVEVILGNKPNVISTNFSQEELYKLTLKNTKQLPYNFSDWRGRKNPKVAATGFYDRTSGFRDYASKCMVVLTPQDLAEKTSTGVFSSNSIQIRITLLPHDGFAGWPASGLAAAVNQNWVAYNHLVFSKEFLRVESDKAQFVSQNVDENVARKLTSQAPRDMSGSGLRVGGGLGVGGRRRRVNPLSKIRSRV
jgi:hypothetical protein